VKKELHFQTRRLYSIGSLERLLPTNLVRVRVWRSGYHDRNQNLFVYTGVFKSLITRYWGHDPNIGHVSLELKNVYISLWPDNLTITNKIKPQDGSLDWNVIIDQRAEGRPPDIVVDFEALDTTQIIRDVETFKKSGSKYHLIGSNRFFNRSNAHNCSGLAYKLLFEAGLKKYEIPKNYFRDYMVVTPNNLISYLESAKKCEMEHSLRNKSESSNTHFKQ
jgi:hypothetical protein